MALLLLMGCSSANPPIVKESDLYFLYAAPLSDHPIWLQSKKGFDDACKELGVHCDWIGPKVIDTQMMEETMKEGIAQKANGIITQGVVSQAVMEQAAIANIPVILVDSNIEDAEKLAYYGKSFQTQAEMMLEEVERTMGEDTHLYIAIQVAELSFDIAKRQIEITEEVFKNHPGGVTIVDISESKSDQIQAQTEWMRVLRHEPDVNLTINFAAESAEACAEIAHSLDKKQDIKIFGVDDMETTIAYIEEGYIDASIVTSFYEYGYDALYQLYQYQKDGTKPDVIDHDVKLVLVNKDNVHTYKEEVNRE